MKLNINISNNVNDQFKGYMGGIELENGFVVDPAIGTNEARCIFHEFPGNLELYHFGATQFKDSIEMHTTNPVDSPWLLIHINLSRFTQQKQVGNETILFQRSLPIGILLCGPGLEMNTVIPQGVETEVLSIRFHRAFIESYIPEIKAAIDLNRRIAYEDIDEKLGETLMMIVNTMDNKLSCHAYLLTFLNHFFHKLSKHQRPTHIDRLHPEDLKRIMEASTLLRDPLEVNTPSLEELSKKAHMGMTKFKDSFKLVFGLAPLQYRNRIRMEYGREELISKNKTVSELSFELGYSHPSNFTAAFKRYFGRLPSSY